MKNITVLGIDLATDVFQLHGVNEYGKKILGKQVSRSALPMLIANMPKCKIVRSPGIKRFKTPGYANASPGLHKLKIGVKFFEQSSS